MSLTIQVTGNNVVSGSIGIYALSNGGEVSVTISGDGSLTASGSQHGISIVSEFSNAALAIEGTAVKASGSYSKGVLVQAGESSTGSLSVDGGSLTASGNTGIYFLFSTRVSGSGIPSLTVAGNAVVDAKSGGIAHNSSNNLSIQGNSGIVFNGSTGTVYGNASLQDDLNISEGESLTLDHGANLNANGHNVIVDGGTLDEGIKNNLGDSVKYTPTITTTSLPNGIVGTGYSTTFLADGTTPIKWSVDSDSLPAGLNLDASTGVISGTPTAEGGSTFTVTAANAYGSDSREFTLKIEKPTFIPVTGVKLNKDSLTLQEKGSDTLTATVEPADATNQDVIWKSSDTSIATVSEDGTVTAISAGNATITATAADGSGKSASCSVTVTHGDMVHTPKKDATCTADGNEEYWTCETCGKIFSDAEGKTEIKLSDTVIPATGHTLTKTEANKATMDASGNIEYWYCSDCEKYFKDEKGEHEITLDETIIAKLPKLLNGANAEWSKGKKEGLTFSVDANISDFIGVKVDQQELDPSMYEVRSGSTIITLKPSYLESLSSGKHEIRMEFKSGTIQTYFTIKKGSDSQTPETGQQTNLYMWIGLLAASALVLGFIGWKRHSK
ncbi:Ig-like domain-containing protein [Faecalicoccus acidiformans]|uniref:Ig-like domain-containing protein n=1 Tax=Faecalicoccus acidiformans TaxID=915173 RepID=UPI0025A476D8|nr:Ig-like domain-containing protein [Faecalicoccus acidiformans]MDM8203318.1 Ig-like domain-containing protein [Faecalicoccus acidiformans]